MRERERGREGESATLREGGGEMEGERGRERGGGRGREGGREKERLSAGPASVAGARRSPAPL